MKLTDNQEKWLQALESGEYEQGIEELHSIDDKFCCLGVACDLFMPETRKVHGDGTCYSYSYCTLGAPVELKEILGISGSYGVIDGGWKGRSTLASMNDKGWSFLKIARFIRANPEKVFKEGEE